MSAGVMRVVSNDFVRVFVGTNIEGLTGAFGVNAGKAYYYRVPENNKYTHFSIVDFSGVAETNVSFSPYMGGDFDWVPVNKCTVPADVATSSRIPVGAVGKMNIVTETKSAITFIKFDGDADENSVMVYGDETFNIPVCSYATGYSTTDVQVSIAGVT